MVYQAISRDMFLRDLRYLYGTTLSPLRIYSSNLQKTNKKLSLNFKSNDLVKQHRTTDWLLLVNLTTENAMHDLFTRFPEFKTRL